MAGNRIRLFCRINFPTSIVTALIARSIASFKEPTGDVGGALEMLLICTGAGTSLENN